jgi:hypothetical protein
MIRRAIGSLRDDQLLQLVVDGIYSATRLSDGRINLRRGYSGDRSYPIDPHALIMLPLQPCPNGLMYGGLVRQSDLGL